MSRAHGDPAGGRSEQERRAEAAEIMDRRAAEDPPCVFIGLPSAITGPYDDVVLPARAKKPGVTVGRDLLANLSRRSRR